MKAHYAIGLMIAGLLAFGCRATAPAPQVESVGQLAPSYNSTASAPVHATTDLTPGFQAVDSDDAPEATTAAPEAVEAPDAVTKGSLVMGTVR